jgi:hypothetical protein
LKPNWRPPWRPKSEITSSKERRFFYTKQLYLNKNKGLKQTTILELYSKTSFVNVEGFKPYFFASWRAKFSSASSNLLNISNIKLIPQKFFAGSWCRILRTIQKAKFKSLKSSDEKPNSISSFPAAGIPSDCKTHAHTSAFRALYQCGRRFCLGQKIE